MSACRKMYTHDTISKIIKVSAIKTKLLTCMPLMVAINLFLVRAITRLVSEKAEPRTPPRIPSKIVGRLH